MRSGAHWDAVAILAVWLAVAALVFLSLRAIDRHVKIALEERKTSMEAKVTHFRARARYRADGDLVLDMIAGHKGPGEWPGVVRTNGDHPLAVKIAELLNKAEGRSTQ